MRLTLQQIDVIKQIVQSMVGREVRIILFGSRLRDDVKGGDVDLLVQSEQAIRLLHRARIKNALEQALSLPVDIVSHQTKAQPTAFQQIVIETGRTL